MVSDQECAALAAHVYNDQCGDGGDTSTHRLSTPPGWYEAERFGFSDDEHQSSNPFSPTAGACINEATGEIVIAYKGKVSKHDGAMWMRMNAHGQDNWLKRHATKRTSPLSLGFVLAALGIAAAAWLAWNWYDTRYPSWKEEVQLSDGRVITVKQKRQYFENYGTNQSWVTFSLPEMGGEQIWHSYLMPQRVDVDHGKVYAFGTPRGPRQYQHYKHPRYFIVAFVWNGKEFQRIPFMEVPAALREEENIFPCVPARPHGGLTLAQKATEWCPPRGDRRQLGKRIDASEYAAVAAAFSRLANQTPMTD